MERNEFLKFGVHFQNFTNDQLNEIIDWERVDELNDNGSTKDQIMLLSQYLVGNISETFNEIKAMNTADSRRCIQTWIDVLAPNQHRQLCIDMTINLI